MDWIQILSWVAVALLLGALHVSARRRPIPHPFGVLLAGIVGALLGGNFVRLLLVSSLDLRGFDLAALLAAAVAAEVAILLALALRGGPHTYAS